MLTHLTAVGSQHSVLQVYVWGETRTGTSLTSSCHRQHSLGFRKLLPTKSDHETQTQILQQLFQPSSFFPPGIFFSLIQRCSHHCWRLGLGSLGRFQTRAAQTSLGAPSRVAPAPCEPQFLVRSSSLCLSSPAHPAGSDGSQALFFWAISHKHHKAKLSLRGHGAQEILALFLGVEKCNCLTLQLSLH